MSLSTSKVFESIRLSARPGTAVTRGAEASDVSGHTAHDGRPAAVSLPIVQVAPSEGPLWLLTAMSRHPTANADKRQTITSAFFDTWNEARARREARQQKYDLKRAQRKKPPPWIVRKLAVFFVIGLLSWVQYVYVGRLCVPLAKNDSPARGTVAQGIAYLIIFEILWLMTMWCYLKVVLVSPGFARDYIKKTPPPHETQEYRPNSLDSTTNFTSPTRTSNDTYVSITAPRSNPPAASKAQSPPSSYRSSRSKTGPIEIPENNPRARSFGPGTEVDAVPARPASRQEHPPRPEPAVRPSWDAPPPGSGRRDEGEAPPPSRSPNNPVLSVEKRYCYKDELVKPYRSHHCSTCATDILMFDHHCIWVGQCIGARNRKFFVNFLQWGTLVALWIFVTLIISLSDWTSTSSLDGEEIAIVAISGFFFLFVLMLLVSHTWLLTINATTVEHLAMQRMHQRDVEALNEQYGWWNYFVKRRQHLQWNHEWGHPHKEGNLWWLGSRRACWEATMGTNPLWWFFPIGRSQSDGLTYPVNPRFAPDGRWRRRSEWPPELR